MTARGMQIGDRVLDRDGTGYRVVRFEPGIQGSHVVVCEQDDNDDDIFFFEAEELETVAAEPFLEHIYPPERSLGVELTYGVTYCRRCGRLLVKDSDPDWRQPKPCEVVKITLRGHESRAEYAVLVDYRCADCGAEGCKLWREYQTFLEHQVLRCAPCAATNQKRSIEGIDAQGRRPTPEYEWTTPEARSYEIGWLVPAIPVNGEATFWGYTSTPQEGIDWWHELPTLPTDARTTSHE